jgi:hypothetical protein
MLSLSAVARSSSYRRHLCRAIRRECLPQGPRASPLPAAVVRRRNGGVLYCEGQRRRGYGGKRIAKSILQVDRRAPVASRRSAGRGPTLSVSYFEGEPTGTITVATEADAVVLTYWTRHGRDAAWKPINQRVPITWTNCHLGGRRPWFICSMYSWRPLLWAAGMTPTDIGGRLSNANRDPPWPLSMRWHDPLRCLVLSLGGGNETALQSRQRTKIATPQSGSAEAARWPKSVGGRRSSAASQETEVARYRRELREALEQQVATAEVL